MELRNLATFACAAELGSFSKAAERLRYAQSTVTAQIDSLEKELGVKLFDRNGKHISLSAAGSELLHYAYRFEHLQRELFSRFAEDAQPSGVLRLGILESISASRHMSGIESFLRAYPNVSLKVVIAPSLQLLEQLRRSEIDLLFLLDRPVTDNALLTIYSSREKVLFFTAPNDPFLSLQPVSLHTLASATWLLTESGCSYRKLLDEQLSDRRIGISNQLEIGSTRTLIDLVKKGFGISLLPAFNLSDELALGRISELSIADCQMELDLQIIVHKNRWLSPAIRAMCRKLIESIAVSQA